MINQNEYNSALQLIDQGLAALVAGTLLMLMSALLLVRALPPARRGLALAINLWPPVFVGRFLMLIPLEVSLTWIYLYALALRIPGMFQSFWYDETFTGSLARLSLPDLWTVILSDVHPPLHYLLMWLIARVNSSEVALRAPSLVAGMFSLWLIYRIARRLLGPNTARWAVLIVALMPAHIHYSNEARAYMLLLCVVLAALLALLDEKPLHFALWAALAPFLHAHGYIFLGFLILSSLRRNWIKPAILAGALGALWLPFMLYQAQHVLSGFWVRPLTWQGVLWWVFRPVFGLMSEPDFWGVVAYASFLVLLVVALRYCRLPLDWWLIVLGVPVAMALISWIITPMYLFRSILATGVLLSLPLAWAARRWLTFRAALLGVMLPSAVFSIITPARMDIRTTLSACEGSEVIYALSTASAIMSSYYAPHTQLVIWPGADDLNQSLTEQAKRALGWRIETLVDREGACIPYPRNPYTSGTQRLELFRTLGPVAYDATLTIELGYFEFWVYRLYG